MTTRSTLLHAAALGVLLATAAGGAAAQEIIRHKNPAGPSPIAIAVTLPPTATITFVSGQVPPVIDKTADPMSIAAFGDTKTQAQGVLKRIKDILEGMGLGIADVVKMQVFLVGDPAKGNRADVKGFSEAFSEYFGGDKPTIPARAVMQVAGLNNPGWLVEIEVTAARK